ncbi:hypothetical protein [Actinocrispum wychmicini]|uniref:Hydantoinase/oxoprolinase-like protein n=1 Tax=Actinocrispum wychmicini TaxID=1213861 RepID=A0A4R2IJG2_9PSEU|nr:hypothetical protein [Actinocrispum wychmicini]TCO44717.1 hydantoinase/oxoprolinase-like protein [Actinocrispum wychmicini]
MTYRLGVALTADRAAGAIVDGDSRVVATINRELTTINALGYVLDEILAEADGVTPAQIEHVTFALSDLQALTELPAQTGHGRGWPGRLARVAAVRLGAATTSVPPLALWPAEMRDRVAVASTCLSGGAMLDGSDYEPLDIDGLLTFARRITGTVGAVAITGVFSSVTPRHELAAADVLREELGAATAILLSHEFGGLGLIERENATVLQAALTVPAAEEASHLLATVTQRGMQCAEVFLARSDGTIATLDHAVTHPLSLLGGTDATSAVGAALLTGHQEALVGLTNVDGTGRAICALTGGMPRMTMGHTDVGGVPTGLSVPALAPVDGLIEDALDRAKDAPGDLPLVIVGPGAREYVKSLTHKPLGTSEVCYPKGAEAAAAVGAAVAPVCGEASRIVPLNSPKLDEIRISVREAARASAMRAGADPTAVAVISAEEKPLAYLSQPTVVMRVRAAGPPRVGWMAAKTRMVASSREDRK